MWVTETALTTALNTAYFAESVATFAIVMGFALMLAGVGFLVLTLRVLRKVDEPAVVRDRGQRARARDGLIALVARDHTVPGRCGRPRGRPLSVVRRHRTRAAPATAIPRKAHR